MIAPRMWNWNVWPRKTGMHDTGSEKRDITHPASRISHPASRDANHDAMRDALVAVLVSHERGYSKLSAGAQAIIKRALIGNDV